MSVIRVEFVDDNGTPPTFTQWGRLYDGLKAMAVETGLGIEVVFVSRKDKSDVSIPR